MLRAATHAALGPASASGTGAQTEKLSRSSHATNVNGFRSSVCAPRLGRRRCRGAVAASAYVGKTREEAAAASLAASRSLLRQVIRQVHPDRFSRWPEQRAQNADALKRLNVFVDTVRRRGRVSPLLLRFFVQRGLDLEPVIVELPRTGSLAPLYRAFQLDVTEGSAEELALVGAEDMSLLDWLADTVRDAVRTSAEHNQLKVELREKMTAIEDRFGLGGVSLAVSEFAISTSDQKGQLGALAVLEDALRDLESETVAGFADLFLVVHQRSSRECDRSHVGSDGGIKVIVEDVDVVQDFLRAADTKRARACQQVATYWRSRAKGVAPKLAEVLRVKAVIGEYEWTGDVSGARDFALFAGRMIEAYAIFDLELQGRRFSYTVLVHGDHSSGAVEYTDRSCVVQVRNDSDPEDILNFQTSEQNESVERHVRDERTLREEEAAILDQVRDALSAKTVISLCSPREHDLVLAAGRRLLAAAPQIRGAVDLTGASICIDDCYDAWDNGFVSLPYDFSVGEIGPALIRLLSNGMKDSAGSYDAPGGSAPPPLRTVSHAVLPPPTSHGGAIHSSPRMRRRRLSYGQRRSGALSTRVASRRSRTLHM